MRVKDSLGREKEVHWYCPICQRGVDQLLAAKGHRNLYGHEMQEVAVKTGRRSGYKKVKNLL